MHSERWTCFRSFWRSTALQKLWSMEPKEFFWKEKDGYTAGIKVLPQKNGYWTLSSRSREPVTGPSMNRSLSDAQNLEETVRSILLLREGVNYGYLLTDEEAKAKAELLAVVLAAVTGNEALVKGVKHLILLGWAYGESLVEVRQLLKGQEVVLVKTKEDWQVPLSGIIALMGNPGAYDEQKTEQKGMSYESFLRLFLTIQSSETLAMRGLDIIEGQLQKNAGCERIHVDHCIERLTAQIWMDSLQMERSYRYE